MRARRAAETDQARAEVGRRELPRALVPFVGPALLFLLALAFRLPLRGAPIYGDEAVLYYLSRYPLQDAPNVYMLDANEPWRGLAVLFWWRPLFRLLLAPGAAISFDAYRLLHMGFASLLPALVLLLLRAHHVRAWLAYGGGLAAVVHPLMVNWGAIVFPDTTMTTAFVGGLLALEARRPRLAGGIFTASIWLKEVAVVGVLFLLGVVAWRSLRSGRMGWRPLRVDRTTVALLAAIILGLAPLLYYMDLGGARPGWTPGGNPWTLVDFLFLSLWVLPLILLGFAWRRTRTVASLALVYPVFYLFYARVLDGGVELWYLVQPVLIGLVALALVLDQALVRARGSQPPVPAGAARVGVALAVGLILIQTLAPVTWAPKAPLTMPTSLQAQGSLREVYAYRDQFDPLADLVGRLEPADWGVVFAVDFGWFFLVYPFAERADTVRFAFTGGPVGTEELERYARLIEESANVTIVHTPATITPLNEAIREAYASCVDFENVDYVVVHGRRCPGKLDSLLVAYERRTGEAA